MVIVNITFRTENKMKTGVPFNVDVGEKVHAKTFMGTLKFPILGALKVPKNL